MMWTGQWWQVYRPHLATADEMMAFHSPEYIDFVRRVTPDNQHDFSKQLQVGRALPLPDSGLPATILARLTLTSQRWY